MIVCVSGCRVATAAERTWRTSASTWRLTRWETAIHCFASSLFRRWCCDEAASVCCCCKTRPACRCWAESFALLNCILHRFVSPLQARGGQVHMLPL